ncbi:hypothetical protein E6W93_22535 [Salmonella enterica subsp. enterica serovar Uppsala]|nr:hypothetical protein [Salmonella enterica subsp. enterica serovar Uppsala]
MKDQTLKLMREAAEKALPQYNNIAGGLFDDESEITCPCCKGRGVLDCEGEFLDKRQTTIGVYYYGNNVEFGAATDFLKTCTPARILELIKIVEKGIDK